MTNKVSIELNTGNTQENIEKYKLDLDAEDEPTEQIEWFSDSDDGNLERGRKLRKPRVGE